VDVGNPNSVVKPWKNTKTADKLTRICGI